MNEISLNNKSLSCFDIIPLNNADKLFAARWWYFSPPVIIKRITWFLRLNLCFDPYSCLTSSILWGTYEILKAIVLFIYFFSNSFHAMQLFKSWKVYLFPITSINKNLNYWYSFWVTFNLFIIWWDSYNILKPLINH